MRNSWDPTLPAVILASVMVAGTVAFTGGLGPSEWKAKLNAAGQSVRLEIRLAEGTSQTRITTDVPTDHLDGFDAAAFVRSGATLRLAWRQDAGSFVLEGEGGRTAGGKARFEPDAAFADRWRSLGLGTPTDRDLLSMAVRGIRLSDVLRLHDLGVPDLDAGSIARVADEPDVMNWVEALHRAGLQPRIEDALRLRAHGISPDDLGAYKDAGIEGGIDATISLHDRGIDAGYVRSLIAAGIDAHDLDGIERLHAHGVSTEYVAGIRASGLPGPGVDDITRLHDQGIDASYVEALVKARPGNLTLDDIVRLHAHGVPEDYVRAVAVFGPGRRDAEDAIRLHDTGVSTEFLRAYSKDGTIHPSTDDAVRAFSRGEDPSRAGR